MNHLSRFMVSAASLLILAGCSDDFNPDNKGNGVNGGDDAPGVYLGINFKMPGMGGAMDLCVGAKHCIVCMAVSYTHLTLPTTSRV